MRTAEEKGKRARTDGAEEDGGQPIDRALLISIEKLQEIQDQIEKVSCFAFHVIRDSFFSASFDAL
jgi:template-activating factor I